jgi:hypothetical protein
MVFITRKKQLLGNEFIKQCGINKIAMEAKTNMKPNIGIAILMMIFLVVPSSLAMLHVPSSESLVSIGTYDFVIITPFEFCQALQPLVPHKQSHGIQTKIVTIEEIYNSTYFSVKGRDNPEKIKYFLKDAIENWGITFTLLVGNRYEMPVRYAMPVDNDDSVLTEPYITDLYYADIYYNGTSDFCTWDSNNNNIFGEYLQMNNSWMIDNMDLYPDLYLGRLLCKDISDVRIVVDKIITYENTTFAQSWFKNLVICGGDTHGRWNDLLQVYVAFTEGKPAYEGEYAGDRIIENMSEFTATKLYMSALLPFGDQEATCLNITNIEKAFNNGAGFVVFSGHGFPEGWVTYLPGPFLFRQLFPLPRPNGVTPFHIQQLENDDRLPIVLLDACSCGNFHISESPLAWEFVRHQNGGAIACYASTFYSWALAGTSNVKSGNGFIRTHIFKNYIEGADKAGVLLAQSIKTYLNNPDAMSKYVPEGLSAMCIMGWEFFGDPTLQLGGYPT